MASSDWFDPRNLPGMSALQAVPALGSFQRNIDDLINLTLDRTVRLAVTGLRQSGKTVFITTLIHHLLNGQELPFFTPVKQKRLLGARLLPPYVGDPPPFPFETSRASLTAEPPAWPEPTRGLSSLRLELRVANTGFLARQFSDYRSQQIEIIDYPGEWLLDLPMMDQSFEDWSATTIELARSAARRDLAADWLSALDEDAKTKVNAPAGPAERERAATLAELYRRYLKAAQAAGFSFLQPGRMTMPGDLAGAEHLNFCPLPPGAGGPYTLMSDRFEHYRDRVVRPFYADHFSRFDRQIVLVDLISALNRGRAVFEDTQHALNTVMESFRYGASSLIARLFRPRIEKLLFVATKADHVAHNQHHNLRLLLEQMVVNAAGHARFEGVQPVFMAIASLRSTDMVKTDHHGQTLSCVRGRLKGEDRETVLFPGEIPPDLPVDDDWADGRFHFRDFAPRRLRINGGGQPQHIRVDQALDILLGDRLT
ncbi:MAG: YcjX family protein [Alphaproteobacteria bacterium]